jgi:hypothetical protein
MISHVAVYFYGMDPRASVVSRGSEFYWVSWASGAYEASVVSRASRYCITSEARSVR